MNGLTKNDSNLIGFVCTCFVSGAIDHTELQQWAMKILGENEHYPDYILDLINFNEARFHIFKTIGFTPSSKFSKETRQTIDQITFHRKGIKPDSASSSLLKQANWINPATVEQFNAIFHDVISPLETKKPS